MQFDEAEEIFVDLGERVGLSLSVPQRQRIESTAHWLASLARSSGVSGYDEPASALLQGMAPALAYFGLASAPRCGHMADLGAGNGAVGATIATITPDISVDLVDRAQRAYTACEILAARLNLPNLRALRLDASTYHGSPYDVVLFRALAHGPEALRLAYRLTTPGGLIIAFHRAEDTQFMEQPEINATREQTIPTSVTGLVATAYRTS